MSALDGGCICCLVEPCATHGGFDSKLKKKLKFCDNQLLFWQLWVAAWRLTADECQDSGSREIPGLQRTVEAALSVQFTAHCFLLSVEITYFWHKVHTGKKWTLWNVM